MRLKNFTCLAILFLLAMMICPGCFVTTHSFNHGKLLNPGEGLVSYGYGRKKSHHRDDGDTTAIVWSTHSFDYRLGFLSRYPFGKGVEFGLHSEFSRENDYGVEYPPALELSARFGLKEAQICNGLYHHNVELGWIIGYWVDNSWFAGYAAGLEYKHIMPYAGLRVILSGTDASDGDAFASDSSYFTTHDRSWWFKYSAGVSMKIKRLPVLPDFISPEISLAHPIASDKKRLGFTWHIGFRWLNGI